MHLPWISLCLLGSLLISGQALAENEPSLPKKALPLPLVHQETGYSSGPAAMLSALKYWKDFKGQEKDLYTILKTTEDDGTHPARLTDGARYFGLAAEMVEGMEAEDLPKFLAEGATVILDIQAWSKEQDPDQVDWENNWEDGHYVVLTGMDSDYVYLMDPSQELGVYSYIPGQEFMRRWHDFQMEKGIRHEYVHLGIVIHGNRPKVHKLPTKNIARTK